MLNLEIDVVNAVVENTLDITEFDVDAVWLTQINDFSISGVILVSYNDNDDNTRYNAIKALFTTEGIESVNDPLIGGKAGFTKYKLAEEAVKKVSKKMFQVL